MSDVWQDPDYDFAESKPERLLVGGLDYSLQRYVVYVAAKPPRSVFRNIAARFGRTIVYIPIGQLSPVSLKKSAWCTCSMDMTSARSLKNIFGETGSGGYEAIFFLMISTSSATAAALLFSMACSSGVTLI